MGLRAGGRRWLRGAALIETLWVLGVLCVIFFPLHVAVLRQGRQKLEKLQERRLRFDGLPRQSLAPVEIGEHAVPLYGVPSD